MGKIKWQPEIIELCVVAIFIVVFPFLIPSLLGFGFGGFESQAIQQKFIIYYGFLFTYLIYAAIKIMKMTLRHKHPALGHDPTDPPALLGQFEFIRNPLKLILGSYLVFGILGLFAALRQTFFMGIPQITAQQISPVAEIYFSVEPAATAETLAFCSILYLFLFLIGILFFPKNIKEGKMPFPYWLIVYASPFLFGGLGVLYHQLAYAGQQPALIAVYLFWTAGTFITLFTGSIIPFIVMHQMNNLFFALNQLYNNQYILVWTIGSLLILGITTFIVFLRKPKKKDEG